MFTLAGTYAIFARAVKSKVTRGKLQIRWLGLSLEWDKSDQAKSEDDSEASD